MFSPKDFSLEQDAYIAMAHYRAHVRNNDNTWTYSEAFCFSQFMEAFPDVNVNYDAFITYKRELINRFEMEHCICKSKLNGNPTNKSLESTLAVPKNAFQRIRDKCAKLEKDVTGEDITSNSNTDPCDGQKKVEKIIREVISVPAVTKVSDEEVSRKRKVPDISVEQGSRKIPSTSHIEKKIKVPNVINRLQTVSKAGLKLCQVSGRQQKPIFRIINHKPGLKSWPGHYGHNYNTFQSKYMDITEDDSDGLEELPFPTDLPLPEPDSPPSEEFTLCPLTGKIVGVDYPEEEEKTIEPEKVPSSVKRLDPEEATSVLRLVPINKLIKSHSEMSSGEPETIGIIKEDANSSKINDELVVNNVGPPTQETFLTGLQKNMAKSLVNDQFKNRKIIFKPFERKIYEDDDLEELPFPNNLPVVDQKSPSTSKANKNSNPSKQMIKINGINKMVQVVKGKRLRQLLPMVRSAEVKTPKQADPPPLKFINKETPNGTKSMVLIRKFKPGMKPIGGRVLLKNTTVVKKPPVVPKIVESVNIVKEEPTEIFEPKI